MTAMRANILILMIGAIVVELAYLVGVVSGLLTEMRKH